MQYHRRVSRQLRVVSIAVVMALAFFVAVAVVLAPKPSQVLAPKPSDRPAGLIQAGDSKTNCIYAHLGAGLRQVEQATGIKYNCLETFSNQAANWAQWISPIVIANYDGYATWLAAGPTKHQIILTMNVVPNSVASNPEWAAKCAAGGYDIYATQLARNLVDSGFGYAVIRLGSEMNGTWNTGSLGTTVAQWHQWAECFAQEVQAMRGARGSHFLFDWNISANYREIPLADFYPGNAYVDIIGIDIYDEGDPDRPIPPVGNRARWADIAAEPEGIDVVEAFAAAHGKPLSFPEWATFVTQSNDANYVAGMGAFIATHDVAFQSWFDVGDDGVAQLSRSQAPISLAAYKKAFGLAAIVVSAARYHVLTRTSAAVTPVSGCAPGPLANCDG